MTRKILMSCVLCALLAPIFLFTATIIPTAHAAQTENYVPLAPIDVPGSEFTSTGATSECRAPTCFPRYLRTIYNVGIVLAGLFAVVSIVRGGFTLMFTDSILGHSEGKGIILRALGGLVIVYSSYILMNAINPALGRDLDLALQFPRITIREELSTLSVVEMSQYQLDLLRDARVRNAEWRQTEITRLTAEITALQTELASTPNDDAHLEERNILNGLIAIKKADIEALKREGVLTGIEHDTRTLFEEATTPEEFTKLIEQITKETSDGSGGIEKMRAAFQKMIDDTSLSTSQIAQLRQMEADRITTVQRNIAEAILERPPKGTFLGREVDDWVTADKKASEQVLEIDKERKRIIDELANLKTASAGNPALLTKIDDRERVVWAQTCNNIALIVNHCKIVNKSNIGVTCFRIPKDIQTGCVTNAQTRF